MSTLQEIEQAIERLSDREKLELRAWFASIEASQKATPLQASEIAAFSASKVRSAKHLDRDQWIEAFNRWVESNRDVTAVADDSRESIYAGRGE